MHRLARLEARRLVHEFIDDTLTDLDLGPDFLSMMRGAMPELPEEPAQEQVEAWVELAELIQDPDFRAGIRRAPADQARAAAEVGQPSPEAREARGHLKRGPARWHLRPGDEAVEWWPAGSHLTHALGPRYAVVGMALGVSEANGVAPREPGTVEAALAAAGGSRFLPTHRRSGLPRRASSACRRVPAAR
jgi:hypothetical protein